MTLLRRLALPILAFAAGTALAAPPPPAPAVYVMRHLQKDAGDDPGLSAEGKANAERLAAWFGADAPRVLYVSSTRRARETAAPLARKLHLDPKEYAPGDVPGLVARLRQESGTVLVIGHSNTVPAIVEALGGARPAAIADDSFGDIWRVASDGQIQKKSLGGR